VIKVISTAKGVNYYLGMIRCNHREGRCAREINVPSKNPAGNGMPDRKE
jgi:hypothetical protein